MSHDLFRERLERIFEAYPPRTLAIENARAAAVLVPIVGRPQPSLIFTVRTDTLRRHGGQISFPGGSIDPTDESHEAAALREAHEEIGLDPSLVRIIGGLDALPTFVSGYVVSPFVGWIDDPPQLSPNPSEVARLLEVPIADLTDEIRYEAGFTHGDRRFPTEAWIWRGEVIWGVTARLLRLFLERLAEAGLAEPPASLSDPWPKPEWIP